MFGVDRAIDRGREHDAPVLLQPNEGVTPGRVVGRKARPGDGDKAAAIGKARQGRCDMARGGVRHSALDIGHHREWRVHQHNARRGACVEMVVDLRGVEAGDADVREQVTEQPRAGLGQFIEDERYAGKFRENGEQACPGRRLQHAVGGCDRGSRAGGKSKWDWR